MEWSSRLRHIFLSRRAVADRRGTEDMEIAGMPTSIELSWIQMLHPAHVCMARCNPTPDAVPDRNRRREGRPEALPA